jgi:hypothetical protein
MRRLCVICSLFACLLTTLMPRAEGASGTIACPRVEFSPSLDGRLDDWPPLPQAIIDTSSDWHAASADSPEYGGPEDASADLRLSWDAQALFVAIEVRDNELERVRSAAEIDRGDSVVLTLAGDQSTAVDQFVVALLKGTSLVWRSEPSWAAGEVRSIGRAIAARRGQDGYRITYELAIPWSEVEQIRPVPGMRFKLTVSVCDDDGAGLKGCLERAIPVVLADRETAGSAQPESVRPMSSLTPSFPAPGAARFDDVCFTIQGKDTLLLGGEIEYTRLPREAWGKRVSLLKEAGLNLVGVTVPWSVHQPAPGATDLSSLRAFLDECKRAGLWVQLSVGPYAGARWEAGAVPGWVLALGSKDEVSEAVGQWMEEVLAVAKDYDIGTGGPVATVVIRPLPDARGATRAEDGERMLATVRAAGVTAPVMTANAPAARSGSSQALVNVLDTLSLYEPVSVEELTKRLKGLSEEEVGPPAVTGMVGDWRTPEAARRSAELIRVAVANGAAVVVLSDFAPGLDAQHVMRPQDAAGLTGVIDAAGAVTPGYGEVRLLGAMNSTFREAIARGPAMPTAVETNDPSVRALLRYGRKQAFLFLWDPARGPEHQVRLRYLDPETQEQSSVPEAGGAFLAPGGAKILPLDLPVGRGKLRYTTSEVLGVHRLGQRTLLTIYGEVDTPGEVAIQLPWQPLVTGEVVRQKWDPGTKTLTLDYYHGAADKYVLIDEVEIAILSRERAKLAGTAVSGEQGVTLVGARVAEANVEAGSLRAKLDCPAGTAQVAMALPEQPSSVTLDGQPVEFHFATPTRVLEITIATPPFSEERRARSVLDRIGRAVFGGPAYLYARFDRGPFMPDEKADQGQCDLVDTIGGAPDALGLASGSFVRLRSRFSAEATAELWVLGSRYPMLVSVNGKRVPTLEGEGADRRADISGLLVPGLNELEMVVEVLPRKAGYAGLVDETAAMPEVRLATGGVDLPLGGWTVCPGLAGEAAGYAANDTNTRDWHFIKFGPWQKQGQDLENVSGVGWYRMSFALPESEEWTIPYYARLDLKGEGKLYYNDRPLALVGGDGSYVLPISMPLAPEGTENVLAAALYGFSPETGLYSAEIAADEGLMTKRRTLDVRF